MAMALKQPTTRLRFDYLDGVRALAALYVLLYHATTVSTTDQSALPQPLRFLTAIFSQGHFGVVVFIVLSGFSLMLPIARANKTGLVDGFGSYLYRRARRILPPYYAALAFSIAIIAVFNVVGPRIGLTGTLEPGALSLGSVTSHIFLIQDIHFSWAFRINGPMWSVATEWWIYFAFPLILLPLLRRTNILVVVLVAWLVSTLPEYLIPAGRHLWPGPPLSSANTFWASPWLLGSFALGMLGAVIGFSPAWRDSPWRIRCRWDWLAAAASAIMVAMVAAGRAEVWPAPLVDFLVSFWAICIINTCWSRSARPEPTSPGRLAGILGSRRLVQLAGFSYSLYLVQFPLLRLSGQLFAKAGAGPTATIVGHLVFVVPAIMAVAWLFAEIFERPFTRSGVLLPALRRRSARHHNERLAPTELLSHSPELQS
jgi:peptidoglycan/LPS O-acetylase OafA/YrhL